jgi:hypothetical protein
MTTTLNTYKVVNGTAYHVDTPDKVIEILENARLNNVKIRIFYGNDDKCWNDEYDTIGTIGRSTGIYKIPILIKNKRSTDGGSILTHCIVRIDIKYKTLYKRDGVKFDKFVSTGIGTVYNETRDVLYARCKNADAGKRLADFMNGDRWAK